MQGVMRWRFGGGGRGAQEVGPAGKPGLIWPPWSLEARPRQGRGEAELREEGRRRAEEVGQESTQEKGKDRVHRGTGRRGLGSRLSGEGGRCWQLGGRAPAGTSADSDRGRGPGSAATLEALGSLAAAFWAALRPGTVLLGAVVFLFLDDFLKRRRPKNYPPGPPPLPFVANFFQLDFDKAHLSLQRFVKKYGNVFSVDFGTFHSVLITGLPLIKEALVHQDQNFANRPLIPIEKHIFNNKGLIMSNGHVWKEQRRFALTTLRNFGLGKKSLKECIQEEAAYLIQEIGEENGQPFDPHFTINNAISNIICSITFGERFDYQDDQFQELLRLFDEVMHLRTSLCCQLDNIFPRIMSFLPGPQHALLRIWVKLKMFIAGVIENHMRDWNSAEARDFIDAYLQEIEKHKGNAASCFPEENLIYNTLDLFFAGTGTTSTTLQWGLLYMALYPEIQEKVQAEIDRVLGRSQKPSMSVRESMPYTNAVIHEVLRMGNIIPLNMPREVAVDTTLAGYHLPKGTMVTTNLTARHRDPAEWATPDTFNPEHFLENRQFKKRESFLPFSIGKRICLGEQLARTELFIFFTSLLQKFTFRPPENEKLSLKFRMSMTLSPLSHHLCAVPRA